MQYDMFINLTTSDLMAVTRQFGELRARIDESRARNLEDMDEKSLKVYYSPQFSSAILELDRFVRDFASRNVPSEQSRAFVARTVRAMERRLNRILNANPGYYYKNGNYVVRKYDAYQLYLHDAFDKNDRLLSRFEFIATIITDLLKLSAQGKQCLVDGNGRNLL